MPQTKNRDAVPVLDSPQLYKRMDPSGFESRIVDLPAHCRQAWADATALQLPKSFRSAEKVLVVGMGGSAIGGDLVSDIAVLEKAPPVLACRDYSIPQWVDERTLVVVSSYSGETEETLASFQKALGTGAMLVAITSGGTLDKKAAANKMPVLRVVGNREPRTTLGYGFVGLLGLLCNLGLLKDKRQDLDVAVKALKKQSARLGSSVATESNQAKTLALELKGKAAVVYGAGILTGVARRWKTQINENAKTWAFYEVVPELNHNSVEGYSFPSATDNKVCVIMLQSSFNSDRVKLRQKLILDELAEAGIANRAIEAKGDNVLAQMLSTILLGDYASYYLAMLNGVDPSQTPRLNSIKKKLSQIK